MAPGLTARIAGYAGLPLSRPKGGVQQPRRKASRQFNSGQVNKLPAPLGR